MAFHFEPHLEPPLALKPEILLLSCYVHGNFMSALTLFLPIHARLDQAESFVYLGYAVFCHSSDCDCLLAGSFRSHLPLIRYPQDLYRPHLAYLSLSQGLVLLRSVSCYSMRSWIEIVPGTSAFVVSQGIAVFVLPSRSHLWALGFLLAPKKSELFCCQITSTELFSRRYSQLWLAGCYLYNSRCWWTRVCEWS